MSADGATRKREAGPLMAGAAPMAAFENADVAEGEEIEGDTLDEHGELDDSGDEQGAWVESTCQLGRRVAGPEDAEPNGDDELSLGWAEGADQRRLGLGSDEREPSLGSINPIISGRYRFAPTKDGQPLHDGTDQTHWGATGTHDREGDGSAEGENDAGQEELRGEDGAR